LAKALSAHPKLLLLDNPFAGLDTETRENLRDFINELVEGGQKIILSCMHPEDIPPAFLTCFICRTTLCLSGIERRFSGISTKQT